MEYDVRTSYNVTAQLLHRLENISVIGNRIF
jgi:hypothetical protein